VPLPPPPPPGITVATLGALVLVQLIRVGGPGSPAYIVGYYLSTWLAQGFLAISAFLGALGSFFSGSTTVSNLTFGDIQKVRPPGRVGGGVGRVMTLITPEGVMSCNCWCRQ
jgi:L-lactate permease